MCGVGRPAATLDLLRHRDALVDVGEHLLVTQLEAEVEELDAPLRAEQRAHRPSLPSRLRALA